MPLIPVKYSDGSHGYLESKLTYSSPPRAHKDPFNIAAITLAALMIVAQLILIVNIASAQEIEEWDGPGSYYGWNHCDLVPPVPPPNGRLLSQFVNGRVVQTVNHPRYGLSAVACSQKPAVAIDFCQSAIEDLALVERRLSEARRDPRQSGLAEYNERANAITQVNRVCERTDRGGLQ